MSGLIVPSQIVLVFLIVLVLELVLVLDFFDDWAPARQKNVEDEFEDD